MTEESSMTTLDLKEVDNKKFSQPIYDSRIFSGRNNQALLAISSKN